MYFTGVSKHSVDNICQLHFNNLLRDTLFLFQLQEISYRDIFLLWHTILISSLYASSPLSTTFEDFNQFKLNDRQVTKRQREGHKNV